MYIGKCVVFLFQPIEFRCKSQSMHSHICKRLFFSTSRQFMMNLVLIISGVDSSDIRYVDFMNICCSCGGITRLIDLYVAVFKYLNTLGCIEKRLY